tara:strand:- start:4711 stop:5427 length:717 start_codon:yes stop_codon:yes gene_type:complete
MKRKTLNAVLSHAIKLGFSPKTIIDVGVAYGTDGLYGQTENVDYLLIEPLQEYESVCQELTQKYGGDYLLAAAGSKSGEIEINVHPDLSGSSILKESEGSEIDGTPRMVPIITIDEVVQDKQYKGPFLIKLDTQGTELDILEGAKATLDNTELIFLEVSLIEFYRGSPLCADVFEFMTENSFVLYDVFGGAYRPLDGALGQIDFAFCKANSPLRSSTHWATPEQRTEITRNRINQLNP